MADKMILKKFEFGIYPVELWVYIGTDLNGMGKKFNYLKTDQPLYEGGWESNCDAFVDSVIDIETRNAGIFVGFRNDPEVGVLGHEALHIVERVWKFIHESKPGREASAYLIEWIINRIKETIEEHGNK